MADDADIEGDAGGFIGPLAIGWTLDLAGGMSPQSWAAARAGRRPTSRDTGQLSAATDISQIRSAA